MVGIRSRAMPWSSLIRAVSARNQQPVSLAHRTGVRTPDDAVTAHRTLMGINVSPVHGHHCICNRCAMLTERGRSQDAA